MGDAAGMGGPEGKVDSGVMGGKSFFGVKGSKFELPGSGAGAHRLAVECGIGDEFCFRGERSPGPLFSKEIDEKVGGFRENLRLRGDKTDEGRLEIEQFSKRSEFAL